jgi:hypothetical protein
VDFEELLIKSGITRSKFDFDLFSNNMPILIDPLIRITILSPTKSILDTLYNKWPKLNLLELASTNISISSTNTLIDKSISLNELAKIPFKPAASIETDIFNSSSIALFLELKECALLLLGDSRPEVICDTLFKLGHDSVKKLKVDLVKVSHHGSINNTSNDLLDIIDCNTFVISTNGGNSIHKHPDRETIARIIYHPCRKFDREVEICLNYSLNEIINRKGAFLTEEDYLSGNWRLIEQSIFNF